MRIHFYLLLATLTVFFNLNKTYAQISYYDAIELKKSVVSVGTINRFKIADSSKVAEILIKYVSPESSSLTIEQIEEKYENNVFIKPLLSSIGALSGTSGNTPINNKGGRLFSSIGGLSIPNEILLGVTDWIVKRAKQELSVYFFDKFKQEIDRYPDLRTVFPQTYRSLRVLGEEIYNYQRYLKTLRTAFQNDIRSLDKNLPTIIDNHPDFFAKHPELAATLQSGFYIANALQEKIHPGDIINDYPSEFLDPLNPNWKGAIQVLQLISASLRDTASISNPDTAYWVSLKQVKELIKDKIAFKIYLGLLYQNAQIKYDGIHFKTRDGNITLTEILKSVALKYDSVYSKYSMFIREFSEKADKLGKAIKDYQKPENDSLAFELYYNYYTLVLDLMQHGTYISKLPFIKEKIPSLPENLYDYFDVAKTAADLVLNIRQRHYSSAVANVVHIYDLVKAIQGEKDQTADKIEKSIKDSAATFNSVREKLFKYGSFLASISEANTSEEVQKVIETFALPAGSSRIKRESRLNVSLNAYAGLFIGNEMIRGVDEYKPFKKINNYGVTTPIGIAVSIGKQKILPFTSMSKFEGKWAHSLFISLVDLGAVAAFRFKDDTTAQVPTIKVKDIFSPGVFWSVGIPRCPLSVNFGAQVGPNLRKIDNNSTTLASTDNNNKTYLRVSASVCVDIPVFNFYTKSK